MGLLIDRECLEVRRPKPFRRSVRNLIGHLLATSLLFLLMFAIDDRVTHGDDRRRRRGHWRLRAPRL